MDIRNESYVNIVDTYAKDGRHLRSVCSTQSGEVVWDEGRQPSKDVVFMPHFKPLWERFWKEANETTQTQQESGRG